MTSRSRHINERLRGLRQSTLQGIRRGVEKESLRVDPRGALVVTPHPAALGSALSHPHITTDFCESQVELVTGPHGTVESCVSELRQLHQHVLREIGEEALWASSMPCVLPVDEDIPIARYGTSNLARMKSVYRTGLGHRYGRRMQTISGIHYNWSMPGLTDDDYFRLIRNFRRHAFLLLYLFGASPMVCGSFVAGRAHGLQELGPGTYGLPHATSLRMGRLGYQSDAQAILNVSYNDLESYARSLQAALTIPYPAYEALGLRSPDGAYVQLATTLLQIENEFYSSIRPKRVTRPDERPLHALRARGVEYVEVRCLDLDPFEPLGISGLTMAFLDAFLLHCLLSPDEPESPDKAARLARNVERTAATGRMPGLRLENGAGEVLLIDWAGELLAEVEPIADALDATHHDRRHREAIRIAHRAVAEPQLLPSARVMGAVAHDFGGAFTAFGVARSRSIKQHLLDKPWPGSLDRVHHAMAAESMQAQRLMEAKDKIPFEDYRRWYLDPARLEPDRN
ncbi:glutamate--cysteine ligase [Piscinibacter sp.]|uniref:glutamate--cysteine ligase n=1 Tax=Piscinibacter sp. TaxID=1903157 RepID=UPI0011D9B70A|nr:MAG: glutamate--cysteine ligase [Burkholderiaceae bacterium]